MDFEDNERRLEVEVEERMEKEIANAWQDLLATESGRLILWSILDKCGCHNFDFYGTDLDTLNRGRQQIGGEILRDFVFPAGVSVYAEMLVEAEIREKVLRQAAELDQKEEE